MILVDFNQVCIANFMMQVGNHTNLKIEEDLIRHMVLNSIRMLRSKFSDKYGELVICCDSKHYWRRDIFPYYKANRKKDRDKSDVDWPSLFTFLNKVKQELRDYFPYKVIEVDGAEADDIIGTLVREHHLMENYILIVSSDKDFMQLQKYKNVDQYSPIMKKMIRTEDPRQFVFEHILKGDRGDGIPNFLSQDDTFVTDKRQKPLSKKKIALLKEEGVDNVEESLRRGFLRNQQLVDLDFIPERIADKINLQYTGSNPKSRNQLLNYFVKYKLKNLTESIGEF